MNEARTTRESGRGSAPARPSRLSTRSGARFWRRWHRYIAVPAALFLLFASTTGGLVAFTEFFGEEEALREATRDMVSPVTLGSPASEWMDPLAAALATAAREAGEAPVDRVVLQLKGPKPTGELVRVASYVDKPFLYRLHSGEALGDGGLVLAMFWGLALALMTVSGTIVYTKMLHPNRPRAEALLLVGLRPRLAIGGCHWILSLICEI